MNNKEKGLNVKYFFFKIMSPPFLVVPICYLLFFFILFNEGNTDLRALTIISSSFNTSLTFFISLNFRKKLTGRAYSQKNRKTNENKQKVH